MRRAEVRRVQAVLGKDRRLQRAEARKDRAWKEVERTHNMWKRLDHADPRRWAAGETFAAACAAHKKAQKRAARECRRAFRCGR